MIDRIVDASGDFTIHIINLEIDNMIAKPIKSSKTPPAFGVIGNINDFQDFENFGNLLKDNRENDIEIISNDNKVCIIKITDIPYHIHIIPDKNIKKGKSFFLVAPFYP